MTEPPAAVLRLVDVTKTYPGVVAVDSVSFDLRSGEVHAIVGENGAGKSTLINLISGVLQPDSGMVLLDDHEVRLTNPVEARRRGIVTVHQEAELFPTLSIAENRGLVLGLPTGRFGLVDWKALRDSSQAAVDRIGEPIDVDAPADRLSVARRHMIQVAAAVTQESRIVILDEPTSALSTAESEWLFTQITRLKTAGAGIIYISHRQDEIFRLADRISVLRDGQAVWTGAKSELNRNRLVELMVGRDQPAAANPNVDTAQHQKQKSVAADPPPARLQIKGLSDADGQVRNVSLTVAAGEVLGVYGLVGAGRTELAHCVFGLKPIAAGQVEVDGRRQAIRSPGHALDAGIAYLPEDRLRQGICRGLSVRANCVLAGLWRRGSGLLAIPGPERAATNEIVRRLDVRLNSMEQSIGDLSGGNQQKVVLGRWLLNEPRVLILDEPTRGVDVAAKVEIHRRLRNLAHGGCAVLLISSELPEIMQNSDRIIVFCEGSVSGEFDPRQASPSDVAGAALPAATQTSSGTDSDSPVSTTVTRSAVQTRPSRVRSLRSGNEFGLAVVTLGLWLCLAAGSTGSQDIMSGLTNLATYAPLWALLGLSAACVIIAGGIDISIGSVVALSAVCCGRVLQLDVSDVLRIPLAVGVGILVGTAGGLLNASISLIGRVHPIVVTLGTMTVYRGLVIVILGGTALTGLPGSFTRLAVDPGTGFRGILAISAVVVCLTAVWLKCSPSGRHLYAFGSSPVASRLAGISQTRVWLTAFGVSGALAGLAGVLELSLNTQMQARLGAGWELQAIAIAVIGGVAITGGRGSVPGVVLAAILLRLVNSALVRWGVSGPKVDLVVGTLLLAAVLLDLVWRRRRQ
ncbi:MAG: ATP-binding cassette domain-containing protein [Fuerstiella sp.]|nr:ATP-binding cassette domain-containing protein [Fuerstiella sp.]